MVHPDHTKYERTEPDHEAGYDSLLTATIMIRLSAKLDVQGGYSTVDADGIYHTALEHQVDPETNDPEAAPSTNTNNNTTESENVSQTELQQSELAEEEAGSSPAQVVALKTTTKRRKKKRNKAAPPEPPAPIPTQFAHSTIFDKLSQLSDQDSEPLESISHPPSQLPSQTQPQTQNENQVPAWDKPLEDPNGEMYELQDRIQRRPMEIMPEFGSEFWGVYGNKLRIFGTQQGVLDLGV